MALSAKRSAPRPSLIAPTFLLACVLAPAGAGAQIDGSAPTASPASVELGGGASAVVRLSGPQLTSFTGARVVPADPRMQGSGVEASLGQVERDGGRSLHLDAARDAAPGEYGVELLARIGAVRLNLRITVQPGRDLTPPRVTEVEAPRRVLVERTFGIAVQAEDDRELASIETNLDGDRQTYPTEPGLQARMRLQLAAPVSEGEHLLEVIAVDAAGNRSESTQRSVEVVVAPSIAQVRMETPSVVGGGSVQGTVILAEPAPLPLPLEIRTSGASITDPRSTTIPQNRTEVEFILETPPVDASTEVILTAAVLDREASTTFILEPPPPVLTNLGIPGFQNLTVTGPRRDVEGSVVLDRPAPAGGVSPTLSTNRPEIVTLPASVTVPAGETVGTFLMSNSGVLNETSAQIRARLAGVEVARILTIRPTAIPIPVSVTFSAPQVIGGTDITVTVTLDRPAPVQGLVLHLGSSGALVRFEEGTQRQVPAGTQTVIIPATTQVVDAPESVVVQAQTEVPGGWTNETITLLPAPGELDRLSLGHPALVSGQETTGFVTFTQSAPIARAVTLARAGGTPLVGHFPSTLTLPAFETQAAFSLTAPLLASGEFQELEIHASHGGRTVAASVAIHPPPAVAEFRVEPREPFFQEPGEVRVRLADPAPPGGAILPLIWNPASLVPAAATQIVIPEGHTEGTGTFAVHSMGSQPQSVSVTVNAPGSGGQSIGLTAYPAPVLQNLAIGNSSIAVRAGSPLVLAVTLQGPAPPAGAVVELTTNRPGLLPDLPGSVTVPSGLGAQEVVVVPEDPGPGSGQSVQVTATLAQTQRSVHALILPPEAFLEHWELISPTGPSYPGQQVNVSYRLGAADGLNPLPPIVITPSEAGVLHGVEGPIFPSQASGILSWQVGDYAEPRTIELHADVGAHRRSVQVELIKPNLDGLTFLPPSGAGDHSITEVAAGALFRISFEFSHGIGVGTQFSDFVDLETDRPDLLELPDRHQVGFSPLGLVNRVQVRAGAAAPSSPTQVTVTVRYHGVVRQGTILITP